MYICVSMVPYHLLPTSGHREVCIWVMGVSGSQGRSVPFSDQLLPGRTQTFAHHSQSEGRLLDHQRGRTPHK